MPIQPTNPVELERLKRLDRSIKNILASYQPQDNAYKELLMELYDAYHDNDRKD